MTKPFNALRSMRRVIRVTTATLVMLHLVPLATSALAAGAYAPLNITHTIDRDHILLSDVFSDVQTQNDRTIGTAPQPGQEITLNARTLMKLASAYGVDWRPTTTADQVVLTRKGTIIDVDAVKTAITTGLGDNGVEGKFNLTYNTDILPLALPSNASKDVTVSRVMIDPQTQNFTLHVASTSNPAKGYNVQGHIERLVDVPVVRDSLTKGTIINASDLELTTMPAALLKSDIILDPAKIAGLTARRNIMPGDAIRSGDIEVPLSMKRGDKITILYRQGVMELAVQGRAMQDGRPGDRVRVANNDSNKSLQGTVTADHQVVID